MASEYAETQAQMRKALLSTIEIAGLGEEGGGFVKGFAIMVEWVGADGRRWLTQTSGDGVGDEIPDWQIQGYFHNFLNTDWTPLADVVEDDDEG